MSEVDGAGNICFYQRHSGLAYRAVVWDKGQQALAFGGLQSATLAM